MNESESSPTRPTPRGRREDAEMATRREDVSIPWLDYQTVVRMAIVVCLREFPEIPAALRWREEGVSFGTSTEMASATSRICSIPARAGTRNPWTFASLCARASGQVVGGNVSPMNDTVVDAKLARVIEEARTGRRAAKVQVRDPLRSEPRDGAHRLPGHCHTEYALAPRAGAQRELRRACQPRLCESYVRFRKRAPEASTTRVGHDARR